MLPLNSQLAALLRSAVRAPRCYAVIQIPLITNPSTNSMDFNKLGSQIVLDQILSVRRENKIEIGADTLDITLSNTDGSLSPISPTSNNGRYFYPGPVDNKVLLYLGLENQGAITVEPKGVFILESFSQDAHDGQNVATINALDQFTLFQGQVYTQFPPRLYGQQNSADYNPNYALQNPSGDLKTYVCDAVDWMQSGTQNTVWASDYVQVTVYTSDVNSGTTATTHTYTTNYNTGTVTFNAALPAGTVVSVDARPLAMSPELMLYHLFVDFGDFSPNFLKFDKSGIYLPIMEASRDRAIMEVAQEIAMTTAPRGIRWQLYFDENGYLCFNEPPVDAAPVRTLIDQYDILSSKPEFTARDIANVVRATGRASNDQTITVISYDVYSINTFSQRPTYDVPTQLLQTISGMDPGSALTFMNGLTSSLLFEMSTPTIQTEIEILYDPTLQVGDAIGIIEKSTGIGSGGIPKTFVINQITEEMQEGDVKQTLRIEQFKQNQDYMFGISFYAGEPEPQNANQIQAASGLISTVSINNVAVVSGGQPVLDSSLNPVLPTWNPFTTSSLPISITLATPPASSTAYIWRWMYISEDAYIGSNVVTGNGNAAGVTYNGSRFPSGPSSAWGLDLYGSLSGFGLADTMAYDVRMNLDSSRSRKWWRPLLRCSDWISGDGAGSGGYTTSTTLNSNWTNSLAPSTYNTVGGLRVGLSDYFNSTSSNYKGVQLYASGTPAAIAISASSTYNYGVDFGPTFVGNVYYNLHRKATPAYLGIMVATTAGVIALKRIPFLVTI